MPEKNTGKTHPQTIDKMSQDNKQVLIIFISLQEKKDIKKM